MRRLFDADAARAAAGARDLRHRRLADQVHLARLGARVDCAAAAGLRGGRVDSRGDRRVRGGDDHRVPSSVQRRPPAERHRAAARRSRVTRTVTILGAGSWGTALAVHLGRLGHDVRLWARDQALVADMSSRRANAVYLPDVDVPDTVVVTHALADALRDAELV